MKKGYLVVLLFYFLAILWVPCPVHAADQLTITANSTKINFPMSIDFELQANSPVTINDIRLRYTVDSISLVAVTSEGNPEFNPGTDVYVKWTMDMKRIGGYPPGTKIKYWWILTDKNGNRRQTDPVVLSYDDERYRWRITADGQITIYSYSGGGQFLQEMIDTAKTGIKQMGGETGLVLGYPIKIYLYASYDDLKGAMVFPQSWVGAVSYTDFQTIIMGVPAPSQDWAKTALKHELSHQITRQLTNNPYCGIPVWLNEGLAVYAQGDPSYHGNASLKKPLAEHTLIPIRSLCSSFSQDPDLARQGYAESYSVAEFLISKYGQNKILELLAAFKQGSTCDDALMKVYNFNMDELQSLWQKYLFSLIA